MTIAVILKKSHTVHLKSEEEICNHLKAERKFKLEKKGDWALINWRSKKRRDGNLCP